ncbi:hypothetical protein P0L94_10495 [Microbacter sp. GSS18]|nr:hypothetical protein P0L94_10495 [Microbacter sp. GSS18]
MPEQLCVHAVGARIGIDLEGVDDDVAQAVRRAWADAVCGGTEPVDATVKPMPGELSRVLESLSQQVTLAAIEARRGQVWMLHAAGVAGETGEVVVLVGPSGRGKTTASRALGRVFGYVSDETIAIEQSGAVHAYRKPLSVIEEPTRPKVQIPPSEAGLKPLPDAPLRVRAIVLLDRDPAHEGVPTLEPVDLGEALEELVAQSSFLVHADAPLRFMAAVAEATGGVRRLAYAEAADLPPIVERMLAAGQEPVRIATTTPSPRGATVVQAAEAPPVAGSADAATAAGSPDAARVGSADAALAAGSGDAAPVAEGTGAAQAAGSADAAPVASADAALAAGSADAAQVGAAADAAPVAGSAGAAPTPPRFSRAPWADDIDLDDPDRVSILTVDERGRGVVHVIAGVAPALWRAAEAATIDELVDVAVAVYGAPEAQHPRPSVLMVVAALMDAGLLVSDEPRVRRREDVAWVDREDRVYALALGDLASQPRLLADTAAVIWDWLEEPTTLTQLAARATAESGVIDPQVAVDVEAYVAELIATQLVERLA